MEYQKIINLIDNTLNQQLSLEQKIWSKQMMNHEQHVTKIIKLYSKLQC